jgi:hypothetical protein
MQKLGLDVNETFVHIVTKLLKINMKLLQMIITSKIITMKAVIYWG